MRSARGFRRCLIQPLSSEDIEQQSNNRDRPEIRTEVCDRYLSRTATATKSRGDSEVKPQLVLSQSQCLLSWMGAPAARRQHSKICLEGILRFLGKRIATNNKVWNWLSHANTSVRAAFHEPKFRRCHNATLLLSVRPEDSAMDWDQMSQALAGSGCHFASCSTFQLCIDRRAEIFGQLCAANEQAASTQMTRACCTVHNLEPHRSQLLSQRGVDACQLPVDSNNLCIDEVRTQPMSIMTRVRGKEAQAFGMFMQYACRIRLERYRT